MAKDASGSLEGGHNGHSLSLWFALATWYPERLLLNREDPSLGFFLHNYPEEESIY